MTSITPKIRNMHIAYKTHFNKTDMKNITAIFLFTATVACAQKETAVPSEQNVPVLEVSMYNSPSIDKKIALDQPYEIAYSVEKRSDGQFVMITNMKLFGGSFYVSPHSTTDFTGKFRIEVAPNKGLSIEDDFIETPRSEEVIDPHRFVNGPVNWVSENTKYEYPLKVSSKEDFDIGGKIIFVIEPKCTLEEIPVMFKYRSGVLTIEPWKC